MPHKEFGIRHGKVSCWSGTLKKSEKYRKFSLVSLFYRYGRVEKNDDVFGSVKVIHDYQKVPPKSPYSHGVPLEKIRTEMEKAGLVTDRVAAPQTYLREFHRKFGKRDYSNVRSLDPVNNSWKPLQVQGKKAELQCRNLQLRTAPFEKDKPISESYADDSKNNGTDSFESVGKTQEQNENSRAVSPFNTLLLPPAYKLDTTRIVGRRALSAPPFDKKYLLLEARSSSLIEKELNNPQLGKKSDKNPEPREALVQASTSSTFKRLRRTKSVVPIGNKPNKTWFCS